MTNREEIERRRTFAIISHPDAGKTTLTEKLLLYGGAINQAGSVKGKQSAKHAVSDWMDIEKQRGISVTSSVLQFNYAGKCVNILDTPGHQDFSEDTYRTLMAADSAVMVIDAAKGVEAQTIKLFKVCTLRHIPIFTFINKMDRETKDPLELCEEVERELGIDTYAVNWPIGSGKEFQGVYDREKQRILFFQAEERGKKVGSAEVALDDPALEDMIGAQKAAALREEGERGDFGPCLVEGPISLDLATSAEAARLKGYCSPVAGDADILLVPSIAAGNLLGKALYGLAGGKMAGVVLGASVPIALNSRGASWEEKYNSILICAAMSRR